MQPSLNRRKTDNKSGTSPVIFATLFGSFSLTDADNNAITISNKKAKAVLALLCLAPQTTLNRSALTELLWPGRYSAQSKASLRQCILALSKLFNDNTSDLLSISRDQIGLNSDLVNSDLAELMLSIKTGAIDDALRMMSTRKTKALLDDIGINKNIAEYIHKASDQIEQTILFKIQELKSQTISKDRLAKAYTLEKIWKERSSKQGSISIAVLPFKTLLENSQYQHIGEGFTDEILNVLVHMPKLQIIGRRSAFLARNAGKTLDEIARTLQVDYVIDGRVRADGESLKVDCQLVNTNNGFEQWSKQYHGNIKSIFTFQERVALTLANDIEDALGVKLAIPKINQLTSNPKAYEYYVQGQALTKRIFGEGVLETAVNLFEQALELDQDFAECWAALAETNAYITVFTPCLDKTIYINRMAECADRALSIDPKSGLALVMKGVYKWTQNDPCSAIELAYKAYEYEPNEATIVSRLGSFLAYIGHTKKALPFVAKAVSFEPLDGRHLLHLSIVLLNLGEVDKAISIAEKAATLGSPSIFMAYATFVKGEHELAVKQYSQTRLAMNGMMSLPTGAKPMTDEELDQYWDLVSKGICSGNAEDRQRYCQVLDHMHQTIPDKYDISIVVPALWMGYSDLLFKTLGKNITSSNFMAFAYLWGNAAPANTIRTHKDFKTFCNSSGLTKAWEKFGPPDIS